MGIAQLDEFDSIAHSVIASYLLHCAIETVPLDSLGHFIQAIVAHLQSIQLFPLHRYTTLIPVMTGLQFKAPRFGTNPVKVNIQLAGENKEVVPSYTTGDRIDGVATVEVAHKTQFNDVEISLEGQ